ncbi:MAG TPA: alkaline phosphatase family protein [Micromonosporaceae bacterium]
MGVTGTNRFLKRHPRFKVAIIGAVAIAGFSVLGALGTASPVSGPAAASTAGTGRANAAPSSTPAPAGLTSPSGVTTSAEPAKPATTAKPRAAKLPRPAHIVIVLEENKSPKLLASHAPYIAALERHGANFTDAFAETHPSQPNYLALFSGSTHGVTSDACPQTFGGGNLGAQLLSAGRTFKGYAESMPSDGYTGCTSGLLYARKHTPWVDFSTVPRSDSLRYSHFPQHNFAALPTVSFVTPNLCDDMHDCSVARGDAWLKANLSAYASWAKSHNSLLIVTFDEAEGGVPNRIPLVMYGAPIVTGVYAQKVNHYSILRTIEDMYGLRCLGNACDVKPMTAAFTAP